MSYNTVLKRYCKAAGEIEHQDALLSEFEWITHLARPLLSRDFTLRSSTGSDIFSSGKLLTPI
jgi:hypothetical protein